IGSNHVSTITGDHASGIAVVTNVARSYGPATLSQDVVVTGNNVSQMNGSDAVGILVDTRAYSAGTTVTQEVAITENNVTSMNGVNAIGIRLNTGAYSSAAFSF